MQDALRRVRFVLVEPRTAGNVGSTARALKNLGFERLSLVNPLCDATDDEARKLAVDAREQAAIQAVLEPLHLVTDRRLRQVESTGRTRDAAGFGNHRKRTHGIDIECGHV